MYIQYGSFLTLSAQIIIKRLDIEEEAKDIDEEELLMQWNKNPSLANLVITTCGCVSIFGGRTCDACCLLCLCEKCACTYRVRWVFVEQK